MLENVGVETATGIDATLSSSDLYLGISTAHRQLSGHPRGRLRQQQPALRARRVGSAPDGHVAQFTIHGHGDRAATGRLSSAWPSRRRCSASAAQAVNDYDGGDGSGTADAGETSSSSSPCTNTGHSDAAER